MLYRTFILFICFIAASPFISAHADEICKPNDIKIGYHQFPNIIEETAFGLRGKTYDIIKEYQRIEKVDVCYIEYADYNDIFTKGLTEVDIMLGAFTLTSNVANNYDYTTPYMSASLGVMVRKQNTSKLNTIVSTIFSPLIMGAFLIYIVFLIISGIILWFAERGNNEGISDDYRIGIKQAIYGAFDISSTVGFGRIEPRRISGRLFAIVIFSIGAIFTGTIIGSISSSLTNNEYDYGINIVEDLTDLKFGTKESTISKYVLDMYNIDTLEFKTRNELVEALDNGQIDAVAYDLPYLQHIEPEYSNLEIVYDFYPQSYTLILPKDSEITNKLNLVIIDMLFKMEI